MIRNPGKVFLTLCLLAVGGGIVAKAQIESDTQLQANVPFAFAVGNTKLPAGKYDIRRVDDNQPSVLELRSANGRKTIVFATEEAKTRNDQAANKTELIFDKVGDQYFLSQIWVADSAFGSELLKSRMERRLADGGSQSEKHSIVAFLQHLKP